MQQVIIYKPNHTLPDGHFTCQGVTRVADWLSNNFELINIPIPQK